ncbi:MAG: GNAT family protein [Tissierellales bacterium]
MINKEIARKMTKTIETERLILRKFKYYDLEDLYEFGKNPFVGPNAGWPPHSSILESKAYLDVFIKYDNVWAIEYKANKKVIGTIGLHEDLLRTTVKNLNSRCLGYALSYNFWGLGITTEAVLAIIDYAFTSMNLDIIAVDHYVENTRSKRVIEKAGFKYEGTLRKAKRSYDNKPKDIMCYSLLKKEWEQNKNIST